MRLELTGEQQRLRECPSDVDVAELLHDGQPLLAMALWCEGHGLTGARAAEAATAAWWHAEFPGSTAEPVLAATGAVLTGTTVSGHLRLPRSPTGRILVPATDAGVPVLVELDPYGEGVHARPRASFDPEHPVLDLNCSDAPALAVHVDAAHRLDAYRRIHQVLGAAEMLGLADHCAAAALDHVARRKQFGTPLARFQAVRHTCAQNYADTELARSMVYLAAAEPPDAETAWQCHLLVGEIAVDVSEAAVHLHGGTGLRWDTGLHRALRRIWVLRAMFDGPHHAAEQAGMAALRRAAATGSRDEEATVPTGPAQRTPTTTPRASG